MKKRTWCLALTGIFTAGILLAEMETAVYGEDFTGKGDWRVTFDGEKMESTFSSQEMAEEIYGILPGDSLELKVEIRNDSEKETDWYMSNEVLKSLEEGSSAQGGAYGYTLWYVNPSGEETVLFESEIIGGEEAGGALEEVTDSLEDHFYLDRLENGAGGTVYLRTVLDGETQGNDYQNTLARLQMNFAAEIVSPDYRKAADKTIYRTQRVKTGDENSVLLHSIIALASGLVLLALGITALKKKNRRKEEPK